MRTLRDGLKYWLALAALACLPLTGRAAMFQVPVAAGGGGGTVTGSVWFPGPFTVSGTNWYLDAAISNLVANTAVTNKFNSWLFWISPTDTNSFFAENRGLGITTNSTDFGALVQSVANRGVNGVIFQLVGNPYYNAHFVISNTVTLTNWITIRGDGNPTTVIRGRPSMSTALFQLGDATHFISGISRFEEIRFEGEGTSAGSIGVHVVNTAEPVFRKVEFTGFLMAGIRVSTLYNTAWAEAHDSWFVQKGANSHGILFDLEPSQQVDQNHFSIKNCVFGNHTSDGTGITVSNRFPGLVIQNSHFRNYSGVSGFAVMMYASGVDSIEGNQFQNFATDYAVQFADRGSATNYNTAVNANTAWTDGIETGHAELVYIGSYVQGVSFSGNSVRGGPGSYFTLGTGNGPINNFDKYELRLGSLPTTNRVLYADADGIVRPVSGTSAETEYVKKDGTVGTPSGSGGATNGSPVIAGGALVASNGIYVGTSQRYKMVADTSLWYIYDNVDGRAPLAIDDADGDVSIDPSLAVARMITSSSNKVSGNIEASNLIVTNGISVLGGAAASIMGISSYQGDMMAFTRATNSPAATGGTNDLQFDRGTVKLGDTMTLMSTSAGQHVWTNGIITLLVTDTNSITIDCASAVNNYVIPTLATNFTVSVTNIHLVRPGRSISVEFPTNLTTSALQVTNAAALGMKWNRGFSTNGYPSVNKTNTSHFSMLFTFPQTNYPVIDAAFY